MKNSKKFRYCVTDNDSSFVNKFLLILFKVFQRICDEKPEMFKKIVPVFGDITSDRLGLNDEQYNHVVSTAQIVFHMAASLKLEATLKPNVEMNLTGTKHVIDVCKKMPNIMALIHLSTAFCNCDQEVLREEIYDCPQKPSDLIRCAEWMSEEAMDILGRKLMSPHPNTCKLFESIHLKIIIMDYFTIRYLHEEVGRNSCQRRISEFTTLHRSAFDR